MGKINDLKQMKNIFQSRIMLGMIISLSVSVLLMAVMSIVMFVFAGTNETIYFWWGIGDGSYEDKLNYDYRMSYNIIRISIKQAYAPHVILCSVGFLAAILVYTLLSLTTHDAVRDVLANNWIEPAETLFANAMLMVGTPMTFFPF